VCILVIVFLAALILLSELTMVQIRKGHQQFWGNLLSSPDNGRIIKEEMNHA